MDEGYPPRARLGERRKRLLDEWTSDDAYAKRQREKISSKYNFGVGPYSSDKRKENYEVIIKKYTIEELIGVINKIKKIGGNNLGLSKSRGSDFEIRYSPAQCILEYPELMELDTEGIKNLLRENRLIS